MEDLEFTALYQLQDKALAAVASVETAFYLTGGTCLHRFYTERRRSDDLDFFSNDNNLFRDDVRTVTAALRHTDMGLAVVVDERDFVRLVLGERLKVDLVNDRSVWTGRQEAIS